MSKPYNTFYAGEGTVQQGSRDPDQPLYLEMM